jgi:acyl carrier protein
MSLPELELEELEVGAPGAKFDLSLSITETGGRLRCAWEYNTDLFEAATIRRMAQHFPTLLQSICEHPGTPIAALTMFDASETTRLMLRGPTEQSLPLDYECVHVKFEEWAARTPDCYVLDSYLRPVPAGVLGELYIAGEGLAWGYVNRPGSTAEVFLPDPFSPTSGARMYGTGDMARYRMDGRLYLLGRRDAQVKLRGYRIELPEIERTLESHPDIQQAALLLLEEEAGGAKGLVAFYTTRGSGFAYAEELQTYLSTKLPAYMIPGSFVPLNSFPRTPNGKLDTRSLAAIKRPRITEHRNYVAPRTELEGQIARIWAYVLWHARVEVQTDFFDELGGHSMLVPQVISMVRYAYHVKLPLRSLFEVRTVAAFAEHVEEARRSTPIQIQPVSRISAPPVSFSQAHIYAQHQETWQSQTLTLTLRLSGSLDLQPLVQALVALCNVMRRCALTTCYHRRFAIRECSTRFDGTGPLRMRLCRATRTTSGR